MPKEIYNNCKYSGKCEDYGIKCKCSKFEYKYSEEEREEIKKSSMIFLTVRIPEYFKNKLIESAKINNKGNYSEELRDLISIGLKHRTENNNQNK